MAQVVKAALEGGLGSSLIHVEVATLVAHLHCEIGGRRVPSVLALQSLALLMILVLFLIVARAVIGTDFNTWNSFLFELTRSL